MTAATTTLDLVSLLQLRDVGPVMEETLARLLEVSGAVGGALFLPGKHGKAPRYLRRGMLPNDALHAIDQWERQLLRRMRREDVRVEAPAQTPLPSRYTLIRLPLNNAESLVCNACLLLEPGSKLYAAQFETLRALCAVAGNHLDVLQALEGTQGRLQRLGLLYEVGQSLASTLELQRLLHDTMALAADAMRAQTSTLMLVDPLDPDYLIFDVAYGARGEQLQRFRMPKDEGVAGWVATHGTPVIVNSPEYDQRFNRKVDLRTGFLTRNILCVPMKMKGRVTGVLQALNKREEGGFDNEDLELLLTIASQAAVAVENARLYRDLRDERDRIIAAQEEVRRELSRNLHDGAVQLIAAISMSVEHAKVLSRRRPEEVAAELDELGELANRAMRQTRTILFELRPVVLETRGLSAALAAYAERMNQERRRSAFVAVEVPPDLPRLESRVERTLFDIVQEAVANARKHARATTITIGGCVEKGALALFVRDDGGGFDREAAQAQAERSGSLGLVNMRERAEMVDAEYEIRSAPGRGTEVWVRVAVNGSG